MPKDEDEKKGVEPWNSSENSMELTILGDWKYWLFGGDSLVEEHIFQTGSKYLNH